jgi:hypothetical protein
MMPYKSGLEITAYSKSKIPKHSRYNSFSSWKEDLTVIEGSNSGRRFYI